MAEPPVTSLDEVRRRARRRLVGAIVLALAAAVLVPLLLESEPKPLGEDVSVRIPPVDSGKFVNRLTDTKGKADPKARPAGTPAKEPAVAAPTKPAEADAKAAEPASGGDAASAPRKSLAEAEQRVLAPAAKSPAKAEPASKSASAPAPVVAQAETAAPAKTAPPPPVPPPKTVAPADAKAAPPAPPKEGGFSVQLAAYSDDKGANALANKLKAAGHAAYVEPYETSRGTLWRVRVGPFASRDAALAARDKLKAEGQNGIVAPSK